MIRFEQYDLSLPSLRVQNVNYLSDDLWTAFRNLYLLCLNNPSLVHDFTTDFSEELKRESIKYFEEIKRKRGKIKIQKWQISDKYFENFTPIWNLSHKRNKNLWIKIWKLVDKWEQQNKYQIHKGTPFYFWAATDIFNGDYDEGMILMHRALNEDRRKDPNKSRYPDTPGYAFVSMDDKPGPYLQDVTIKMVNFVKRRLSKYNGNLAYKDLQKKFLRNPQGEIEDIKYLFSYSILRLMKLRQIHKARTLADKQMSSLVFLNALGSLILVIDEIFKIVYASKNPRYFSNSIYYYLIDNKLTSEREFSKYLTKIDHRGLNDVFSEEFRNNKYQIFQELLNTQLKDANNKNLSEKECQLLLCYCLRNFSAHRIKGVEIFWEPKIFTDLLQQVFNVLFMAIERL